MKITLFSFFLFFSFVTYSQKDGYTRITDVLKLEDLINSNSNKINTIKCDFIQEKKIDYLDEVIVSKGKFWFKKDNYLRWEYTDPFSHIIAIRDNQFTIKDEKNVSTYDINTNVAFKEINDLIISMAKSNMIKDNKFSMEAYENKTSYFLKLTPKDEKMKNFISKSEVYIDKSDMSVSKVIMKESETDYTVITFINRKLNEEIPDSIFIIK